MTISRRKIAVGTLILGSGFLLQAGVTALMKRDTAIAVDNMETLSAAVRNHMQADMMHDAIRGSVYRELYFADQRNAAGARSASEEVIEYSSGMPVRRAR